MLRNAQAREPSELTVLAIGGNALIDPELPPTVQNQFAITARAMVPVVELIRRGERLLLTHGNGPQVGFMALRSELSRSSIHEVPLDSLVADTQGSLGYMIQRALREDLRQGGVTAEVASLITEIEVDPDDHAFEEPTKPIGLFHAAAEAAALQAERGWRMIEDSHRGWRRVVPSPAPVRIVQIETIRRLVNQGVVVIACGGGGIPIVRSDDGYTRGVEGVIDKDRASALLAVRLGAQRLILTTAVDGVYTDFLTEHPKLLRSIRVAELLELAEQGQFPSGSMGPKIKSACRFIEHGGKEALICKPDDISRAFEGKAGTRVIP